MDKCIWQLRIALFSFDRPPRITKKCRGDGCYGYGKLVQLWQWMRPSYGHIEWLLDQHYLSITCCRSLGADSTSRFYCFTPPRSRSLGLWTFLIFIPWHMAFSTLYTVIYSSIKLTPDNDTVKGGCELLHPIFQLSCFSCLRCVCLRSDCSFQLS